MVGVTAREIAEVLEVLEAGARAGFDVPDRVRVGARTVRIAWSFDAGLDSVCEFPTVLQGDPVMVADVWCSSNDGYLKVGVWHGQRNVGGCHLDGVPGADLIAAWPRLFGYEYSGELEAIAA